MVIVNFQLLLEILENFQLSGVDAKFALFSKLPSKDELKTTDMSTFSLGPMLPSMDKQYWFFIPSDKWKKAEDGQEKIFYCIIL